MPFEKGHKFATGGKREGAGRPSGKELKEIKSAADKARAKLEASAGAIMGCYVGLASSGNDPATTRHAVDKLLPDEKFNPLGAAINIQFVQYQHPVQLPAEGLPITILASDADQEAGLPSVAPQVGQGQGGIKFHDFQDVPGEPRRENRNILPSVSNVQARQEDHLGRFRQRGVQSNGPLPRSFSGEQKRDGPKNNAD
jgi:hypothetical protein